VSRNATTKQYIEKVHPKVY